MSLYSALRPICHLIQKVLWPTKIIGKNNVKDTKGGAIVISNHYSTPDSIIIATNFFKHELHVMVKEEAFKKSFASKFLTNIGCISVKRGEPDIGAYKAVLKVLNSDKKMMIFPEGTRNKSGTKELAPFKNGVASFAIKSGKPVIPMLYYRMHKLFHRNYLIVGEPIDLREAGFDRSKVDEATSYIQGKMYDLRNKVDKIAEGKNN
ncbi:MAG: lysophospholipid acyltransferase family protein [Clostridia bacterium]